MTEPERRCSKLAYRSEREARLALGATIMGRAKNAARQERRVYLCAECSKRVKAEQWHLTSMPLLGVPGQAISKETEAQFQKWVMDLAKLRKWLIVHIRAQEVTDPDGAKRWSVPYEGHKGLPDLIMARRGIVLLVELKSSEGMATAAQKEWLKAAGPSGRLWRPADKAVIQRELS